MTKRLCFPKLRKDADPGIAEVEDARERVAGLNAIIYSISLCRLSEIM